MHKGKYKSYDSSLKLLVLEGRGEALRKGLNIPRSTIHNWRKSAQKIKDNLQVKKNYELANEVRQLQHLCTKLADKVDLAKELLRFFVGNTNMRRQDLKIETGNILRRHVDKVNWMDVCDLLGKTKGEYSTLIKERKKCNAQRFSSCPRIHPCQLTRLEISKMKTYLMAKKYRHMPIRSLALYCRKNNLLSCNVETWYKYSKKNNWVRPKPERLKHEKLIGLRAKEPNEVWHMDITHLKTTVGKTYYLQVIIDNYSRFVVGWKIASAANALESAELLKKSKLVHYKNVHLVTDGGPENDNRLIRDTLVTLKSRLSLARHDICSSNSLVESFFRSLKNNYLYGQKCKTFKSLKSKVGFYIRQHNEIMPHNAFHSATPQEVFKDPQLATEKSFKGVAMKDVMQERIFCNTLVRCQSCS